MRQIKIIGFVFLLSFFCLAAGADTLQAADTAATATTTGVKAPAKEKAAALTKEQQTQVKTWNDRLTYLKQAEDKALNDIVNGRIEQAQIANAYKQMTAKPKGKK